MATDRTRPASDSEPTEQASETDEGSDGASGVESTNPIDQSFLPPPPPDPPTGPEASGSSSTSVARNLIFTGPDGVLPPVPPPPMDSAPVEADVTPIESMSADASEQKPSQSSEPTGLDRDDHSAIGSPSASTESGFALSAEVAPQEVNGSPPETDFELDPQPEWPPLEATTIARPPATPTDEAIDRTGPLSPGPETRHSPPSAEDPPPTEDSLAGFGSPLVVPSGHEHEGPDASAVASTNPTDGGQTVRRGLIAAACVIIGLGIVLVLGRPEDPSETANSDPAVGAVGGTTVLAPSTSLGATDQGNGAVSSSTDSESSESTAPSLASAQIVGVAAGDQLRAGEVVSVSVEGVEAGVEVALLVDGVVVDRGQAGEFLTWTATAGGHVLSIDAVGGGAVSTPVPIEVLETGSERLRPVSAVATNERPRVSRLRCGGSNSFESELLIDGDTDTGWGASAGDGRGESVTIDFGQEVTVTRIGLSPGYLRVAPRASNDCRPTSAFEFNRFVERVEYRFDDGTTVTQAFAREATIQELAIAPVSTRRVTILILSTDRQVEDDDTVLSEAVFYGSTP